MRLEIMAEHTEAFLAGGLCKIGSLNIGSIENQKKGMLVDTLENVTDIGNLGKRDGGKHDFRILGRKASLRFDKRRTPLNVLDDGLADGIVSFRNDKEHFLCVDAVNRAIREDTGHIHGKERVESDFDIQDAHSDDDEDGVGDEAGRSDVHAVLLLHNHADEIDATCRCLGAEDEATSDAIEHASEERSKEEVFRWQMCSQQTTAALKDDGVDDEAENGKTQKLMCELVAEHPEKRDVDDDERDGDRNAERQVEDTRNADRTVCKERERCKHHVDTDGGNDASEKNHGVLLCALVSAQDVGLEKKPFF